MVFTSIRGSSMAKSLSEYHCYWRLTHSMVSMRVRRTDAFLSRFGKRASIKSISAYKKLAAPSHRGNHPLGLFLGCDEFVMRNVEVLASHQPSLGRRSIDNSPNMVLVIQSLPKLLRNSVKINWLIVDCKFNGCHLRLI
jgi:hypothetical protein